MAARGSVVGSRVITPSGRPAYRLALLHSQSVIFSARPAFTGASCIKLRQPTIWSAPTIAEANVCNPYTASTCGYINLENSNTGRITTDGIDLSIQYLQRTPIGTFHEDLEGTAVLQFLQQQYNGGPTLNLVNNLQIQTLNPAFKWQHNVRVDWTSPEKMWGGGLSDRFYSSYIDEYPDGNGNQQKVGSYSLVDGYVSIKPIEPLTVLVGIKNVLDRSPPFTNAYQGNFAAGYNALNADPLLRNFYINLRYKFF